MSDISSHCGKSNSGKIGLAAWGRKFFSI